MRRVTKGTGISCGSCIVTYVDKRFLSCLVLPFQHLIEQRSEFNDGRCSSVQVHVPDHGDEAQSFQCPCSLRT